MKKKMFFNTSVTFSAEYQAILDYATTNSITHPSLSVKTAQNQLVLDLKSYSLWSKLDSLNIFACGDSALTGFMKIDWILLNSGTVVGGLTYSNDGISGNGTTQYFTTAFVHNFSHTNYKQNSASKGVVISNYDGIGANGGIMGFAASNVDRWEFNSALQRINQNFTNLSSAINFQPSVGGSGSAILVRTSSSDVNGYVTGTKFTRTATSSTVETNGNITLGKANSAGTASRFASSFFGGSLTDTDVSNLRTAFNTYFVAIGLSAYA